MLVKMRAILFIWRFAATVLSALLVLYIWNWDYTYFIHEIPPKFVYIWGGLFLLILIGWRPFEALWLKFCRAVSDKTFAWGITALTFGLTSAIATFCYDSMPHVQDEIDYLFQARIFAEFKLYAISHPLAEFFNFRFLVNDGKWYALFQPGWPLAMVPFVWLKVPHLAAPFYSSATVFAAYKLFKETTPTTLARAAILFWVVSPFFLFMSASMMSHPLCLLLTVLALLGAIKAIRQNSKKWATIAGLALGALAFTRAATAVGVAIPILIYALVAWIRGRAKLLQLIPAVIFAALPFLLIQLGYNYALTDNPFVLPQHRYFRLTEQNPNCHTLGFGPNIGCRYEHGPDIFWSEFTPQDASVVTHIRLNRLKGNFYGLSVVFLLLIPALAFSPASSLAWLHLGVFLGLVGIHFLYYYHGVCYGARYYYEASASLVYLFTLGVAAITRLKNRALFLGRTLAAVAVSLLIALSYWAVVEIVPQKWKEHDNGFWGVDRQCLIATERANVHNALVFGSSSDKFYRECFWLMDHHIDSHDIIYVRDLGLHNENIARYYPNRRLYKFTGAAVVPTTVKRFAPDIFLEAEAKFPVPFMKYGWNTTVETSNASGGKYLLYNASYSSDSFGFRFLVFEQGVYDLELHMVEGPRFGIVQTYIDQHPVCPPIDNYETNYRIVVHRCHERLHLQQGLHTLRFEVLDKNERSSRYDIGVDAVKLIRVDKRHIR